MVVDQATSSLAWSHYVEGYRIIACFKWNLSFWQFKILPFATLENPRGLHCCRQSLHSPRWPASVQSCTFYDGATLVGGCAPVSRNRNHGRPISIPSSALWIPTVALICRPWLKRRNEAPGEIDGRPSVGQPNDSLVIGGGGLWAGKQLSRCQTRVGAGSDEYAEIEKGIVILIIGGGVTDRQSCLLASARKTSKGKGRGYCTMYEGCILFRPSSLFALVASFTKKVKLSSSG